jgi:3-hydroxyisobutyrate dehydrogenase-like beta-hydroxyacid dehydrogenase
MTAPATRICLLGFGEVGQTLAGDLAGQSLSAWDILFGDVASRPCQAIQAAAVRQAAGACDAVIDAELVISAVTAAQDHAAAAAVAPFLPKGCWFLDLNSAAPETKKASAALIDGQGGRYVEAAVMAPIGPKRIATRMLLGGPHAADFAALAQELGFSGASVFSPQLGQASASKMCRSVMIKGIEALLTESLIAARHYGVEQTVLDSLSDLLPIGDWPKLAHYMIARSLEHGARRAEEMREVAATIGDAGLTPILSQAIALRQDWTALRRAAMEHVTLPEMLDDLLDRRQHAEGTKPC